MGWKLLRRRSDEGGQVLTVWVVICFIPLFLMAAGIAIDFGAVYSQRAQYNHAAELAAKSGAAAITGYSDAGGYGNGALAAEGQAVSPTAEYAGWSWAAATLHQSVASARLKAPQGLMITYLAAGQRDPCTGGVVQTPAELVQFRGTSDGLFFASSAFHIGILTYPVCQLAAISQAGASRVAG